MDVVPDLKVLLGELGFGQFLVGGMSGGGK